jgi:hypothetical protein
MAKYQLFYEIVESERFGRERDEISKDVARWDEVMNGVTWALAREPETAGKRTVVEDVYGLPTEAAPGVPATVIYYRVHARQVELLSVRLVEDGLEL